MNKTEKIVMALVSVFCLVLLGSSAFAQPFAPAGGPEMCVPPQTCFNHQATGWTTFEGSWLIGHQVTDTQGGYLGEISSLVIDNTNGRIALVVLSNVPNIGGKHLALPFSSIMRTGENIFEFNPADLVIPVASGDRYVSYLTSAPGVSELYGVPPKIDLEWVSRLYQHYGQEPYWTQAGEQAPKGLSLYQSTKLMGAEVQTPKGEEVAQVNDLVIDSANGHIVFVVLSDIAGRRDTLLSVPFSALSRRGDNVFVLNTTKNQLASAPRFNEVADLGNLRFAENVYRFFGLRPYWTEGGDTRGMAPYRWGGEAQDF
jgi:sporulation protein YlmC with PRC-barrel domain